jgi:ubiquitin carboxyl-terminal hydrolase L3
MSGSSSKKWFPLEANPEVMTKYLDTLGVRNGYFTDIFGLDEELLAMVPRPVLAVLLLYPITSENEGALEQAHATLSEPDSKARPFFMKQTVSNACGTVGIVHAVTNNTGLLQLTPGGVVERFVKATENATPEERADWFEQDPALEAAQAAAAQEGQTDNRDINADINLHFICHVVKDGRFFELDGRKPGALDLGPCSEDDLLQRAGARAQEFMKWNPDEVNFTLVALCAE